MRCKIEGCYGRGEPVYMPASKSLSHRALIAAALAEGTSVLKMTFNEDIEATVAALRLAGAVIDIDRTTITVKGTNLVFPSDHAVNCGQSGSTLRFLLPLAARQRNSVRFTGSSTLLSRPQSVYQKLFDQKGLQFEREDSSIRVRGPLKAGSYVIDGSISSQFVSGLLFTLPLLSGDSTLTVEEPWVSRPYVTLTLQVLRHAGIEIVQEGNVFHIKGEQSYQPFEMRVEGDASQAVYFAALGCLSHPTGVRNLNMQSDQGDLVFLDFLAEMGARVERTSDGFRVIPAHLNGIRADLSCCPDLAPILFVLASRAEGPSVFTGCGTLRYKESDRIASMQKELAKTGCVFQVEKDTVTVYGPADCRMPAEFDGHQDHRIVMALAVLAAASGQPVTINGAEAITKSYPDFFADLRLAGVNVQEA